MASFSMASVRGAWGNGTGLKVYEIKEICCAPDAVPNI